MEVNFERDGKLQTEKIEIFPESQLEKVVEDFLEQHCIKKKQ